MRDLTSGSIYPVYMDDSSSLVLNSEVQNVMDVMHELNEELQNAFPKISGIIAVVLMVMSLGFVSIGLIEEYYFRSKETGLAFYIVGGLLIIPMLVFTLIRISSVKKTITPEETRHFMRKRTRVPSAAIV
jgi:hypothetical protein